jgi:hypothetical protein
MLSIISYTQAMTKKTSKINNGEKAGGVMEVLCIPQPMCNMMTTNFSAKQLL